MKNNKIIALLLHYLNDRIIQITILFTPIFICLEIFQQKQIDDFMHGLFTIVLIFLTNIANSTQIISAIATIISGYIAYRGARFLKNHDKKE